MNRKFDKNTNRINPFKCKKKAAIKVPSPRKQKEKQPTRKVISSKRTKNCSSQHLARMTKSKDLHSNIKLQSSLEEVTQPDQVQKASEVNHSVPGNSSETMYNHESLKKSETFTKKKEKVSKPRVKKKMKQSEPTSLSNIKPSSCEHTEKGAKDSHCIPIKKRNYTKRSIKKSIPRKTNEISEEFKPETNGKMNTGLNNNSASRMEQISYEPIAKKTPAVYKKINGLSTDTQIMDNVKYGMPKGRGRKNSQTQAKPNKLSLVLSATSKVTPQRIQNNKQTLKKKNAVSEQVKK